MEVNIRFSAAKKSSDPRINADGSISTIRRDPISRNKGKAMGIGAGGGFLSAAWTSPFQTSTGCLF
jgi:hypothetical protein